MVVKSSLKKAARVLIHVIVLTSLVSLAGYYLLFHNLPTYTKLPPVSDCKLQRQACLTSLTTDAEVEFEISPKNPDPTELLYLDVSFKGISPDSVRVRFDGKSMKMGPLEYELKKQAADVGISRFSGKGGLSVCIRGVMEWVVVVSIKLGNELYEVPFEMETHYNP